MPLKQPGNEQGCHQEYDIEQGWFQNCMQATLDGHLKRFRFVPLKQTALKWSENKQRRPWNTLKLSSTALDHLKAIGGSMNKLASYYHIGVNPSSFEAIQPAVYEAGHYLSQQPWIRLGCELDCNICAVAWNESRLQGRVFIIVILASGSGWIQRPMLGRVWQGTMVLPTHLHAKKYLQIICLC